MGKTTKVRKWLYLFKTVIIILSFVLSAVPIA